MDSVSGLECPHPPQDGHHLLGLLRALVMFVPHLLYTESLASDLTLPALCSESAHRILPSGKRMANLEPVHLLFTHQLIM